MQQPWTAAITASVLMLAGCSTTYEDPKTPPLRLADITAESLQRDFQAEHAYRGSDPAQRRIGLAMSGGGTKAGMFSHGVLHGLQRSGILQKVDVISTASGSNYPVFWYFTKQIEAEQHKFDPAQIFDDCVPLWYGDSRYNSQLVTANVRQLALWAEASGYPVCRQASHYLSDEKGADRLRWQAHLARWPDVFETNITEVTGDAQKAPWRNTFWLSGRLLGETVLTLLPFDSGIPIAYMRGIERTWGLNPKPRDPATIHNDQVSEQDKWQYTNAAHTAFGAYHVDPEHISWDKFQSLYARHPALPLWVMNTTEGQKGPRANMYNLYELTPYSYGSARHGYHLGAPPMPSMSYGVRASAAFFDKQGATGGQRLLLNMVDGFIPAVTWGVKIKQPTPPSKKVDVRLSDGGGAENLGLLSLLRRGLDQIIVIDTAQDVEGRMDDLCWAKAALDEEGFELRLPALEKLDKVCQPKQIDAETLAYNVSEWKNPIIVGTITPKPGHTSQMLREVKLFWIKAAWNEYTVRDVVNQITNVTKRAPSPEQTPYLKLCGQKDQINCWLPVYFAHNAGEQVGSECIRNRSPMEVQYNDCFLDFPQLKTVNTTFNSSSYQFWAYRELAASAANQLRINDRGELETTAAQCLQRAKAAKHGRRPTDWDITTWKKTEQECVAPGQAHLS